MKVCLVTGASSGIGLATALDLLGAGYVVYGAARRVERMDVLRAAGGHVVPTDLRDPDDLDRLVATVVAEQGRIDVLVSNAGTVLHGAVEDVPLDTAREYLDLNLLAPARLAQLVLPHMRAQGSGTIVNVSSVAGEIAMPLGGWYYAAKHGLEALSDTLRMEVGQFGIDVVIIQPGIIRTEFGDRSAEQLREFSGEGAYRDMAGAMAGRMRVRARPAGFGGHGGRRGGAAVHRVRQAGHPVRRRPHGGGPAAPRPDAAGPRVRRDGPALGAVSSAR